MISWCEYAYPAYHMKLRWAGGYTLKGVYIKVPDSGQCTIVQYQKPTGLIDTEEVICGPFESLDLAEVAYLLLL